MTNDNDVITVKAKTISHNSQQESSSGKVSDNSEFKKPQKSKKPQLNGPNPNDSWRKKIVFYITHPVYSVNLILEWIKAHPRQVRLAFLYSGIALVLVLTGLVFWLMGKYNAIGDVRTKIQPPTQGSVVYDRNGKEMFSYFNPDQQRESVNLDQIPEHMQQAVVALEDENFYTNPVGIPWTNLVGAAGKCLVSDDCRGGSGLSQQLVKNATGDNSRSMDRKITELLTAIKLNQELNKQDILELYLNYAPFGRNVYGVQQSSKAFYGYGIGEKDAAGNYKLTLPQACLLATMPQKPGSYTLGVEDYITGNTDSDFWKSAETRKNICLRKLYEKDLKGDGKKLIQTEADLQTLQQEKIAFIARPPQNTKYNHLRIYIANELEQKLGITEDELASQGYEIRTTFDIAIQDGAERIVKESQQKLAAVDANNAAAVILDGPTGGVVAMVGSIDFNNVDISGQVNVATSPRQPGSSFKPYVYAAAFEKGFNPGTRMVNVLTDFGQYAPQNFARNTPGIVSIRYAFANSLNIPAVKSTYLLQNPSTTPDAASASANLLETVDALGVKTPLRNANNCGVSSALGTCEVTALSHAGGINALLHDGILNEPDPFISVILKKRDIYNDKEIKVDVYAQKMASSAPAYTKNKQVLNTLAARQVTNVMSDYTARDPAVWGSARFGLQLDGWDGANSVAAKTGTTSDVKDTWTVGGSPLYTVVTWAGNTDNRPLLNTSTAVNAAMPIWNALMTNVHAEKTPVGFNFSGLTKVNLDPKTGFPVPTGGSIDLLTPAQLQLLTAAQQKLSNGIFDPYTSSVFENRSEIVPLKIKVNVADGKRVPKDSTLPTEFIEEIECRAVISAFPLNPSWYAPAKGLNDSLSSDADFKACPTEFTTATTETLLPVITANVESNGTAKEALSITAKSANPKGKIVSIEVKIDGNIVDSVINQSSVEIDWQKEGIEGDLDIIILAEDEFGKSTEKIIKNVTFDPLAFIPKPLTDDDLASLVVTCSSVTVDTSSSCTITLPALKTIPSGFKLFIGSSTTGGSCSSAGVCANVPTTGNTAGSVAVKASITGSSSSATNTASTVVLK